MTRRVGSKRIRRLRKLQAGVSPGSPELHAAVERHVQASAWFSWAAAMLRDPVNEEAVWGAVIRRDPRLATEYQLHLQQAGSMPRAWAILDWLSQWLGLPPGPSMERKAWELARKDPRSRRLEEEGNLPPVIPDRLVPFDEWFRALEGRAACTEVV